MAPVSVPLIMFGVGGVGRSLLQAITFGRIQHLEKLGLQLKIVALCDSSGGLISSGGLADNLISNACDFKSAGNRFSSFSSEDCQLQCRTEDQSSSDFLQSVVDSCASTVDAAVCTVVDCTATEDTVPALLAALRTGMRVAAANKKPFTASQVVYDELTGTPKRLQQLRYESTVGAGLPVITTLTRTVTSTDEIRKISGTFSGTLGFVMTGLQQGQKFSEVVGMAKKLGYTEPDPREDLGGMDVARKALILARGMGWRLEMADVEVEPLFPPHMAELSVSEFMAALPSLDTDFEQKVQDAAKSNSVLRYAAVVEGGKLKVQPVVVSVDSPLGRLGGTDNLVEMYTKWYTQPLVIQGAGAGTEVTAAGILSDIIELAFCKAAA